MHTEHFSEPELPQGDESRCFVIRPNASMSPKSALIVFLSMLVLSAVMVIRFLLMGAWVIVPYTVLEVAVLGVVLLLLVRDNQKIETIVYTKHELKVIKMNNRRRREWTFQPCWARVLLQPGAHAWYPDRLLIRSHGKSLEIGKCLTGSEKSSLAKTLRALMPSADWTDR